MNRLLSVLTIVTGIFGGVHMAMGDSSASGAGSPGAEALAASANRFGLDLYAQLRGGPGNLFFSPYSIQTALMMTYTGAAGDTSAEMASALHLTLRDDALDSAAGELISRFQSDKSDRPYQFRVANALWGGQGVVWTPVFLNRLERNYRAGLVSLDFAQSEAARKTINDWVARQTADKIQNLIPSGAVNAGTRLVLTNAVYFKGDWQSPFASDVTANGEFHLRSKDPAITVPMMHQTASFQYMENDQFQGLQMPYKGDDLAMLILLPKSVDGIGGLESTLDSKLMDQTVAALHSARVQIAMPKFKMSQEFSLGKILGGLGITKALDPHQADFSGMDGMRDLYLSEVVHKSFVAVDEKGTEAAAATGIVMRATAMPAAPPLVFTADHPFIVMIRDTHTGVILFLGRVDDPSKGG